MTIKRVSFGTLLLLVSIGLFTMCQNDKRKEQTSQTSEELKDVKEAAKEDFNKKKIAFKKKLDSVIITYNEKTSKFKADMNV